MNPDFSKDERAALESSLTALLLGELPHDQAAALHQKLAQDVEFAKLYERLKQTINLVREAVASPASQTADQPTPHKLSDERRQELLQQFKTITPKQFAPPRRRRTPWLVRVGIAAALVLLLAATLLPHFTNRTRSLAQKAMNRDVGERLQISGAASAPSADSSLGNLSRNDGQDQNASGEHAFSGGTPIMAALVEQAAPPAISAGTAIVLPRALEVAEAVTAPAGAVAGKPWPNTSMTKGFPGDSSGQGGGMGGRGGSGGSGGETGGNLLRVEGRQNEVAAVGSGFREPEALGTLEAGRPVSPLVATANDEAAAAASELVPLEIKLPAPAYKGTPKDVQNDGDLKQNEAPGGPSSPPMVAGNSSFGFGLQADSTVQGPGGSQPQTAPEANAFRRRYASAAPPPAANKPAVTAAPANVPSHAASAISHDARLLYEMGKLAEADVKLKQALKEDPHNEEVLRSLNLVSEAKFNQAAKSHEVPLRQNIPTYIPTDTTNYNTASATLRQNIRTVEQAWANPVNRELLPAESIPAEGLTSAGRSAAPARTEEAPASRRLRVEKFGVAMPDTERTAGDLVVSGRGLKPGQDTAGIRKGAELLREPGTGEPGQPNPTSGAVGGFAAIPQGQAGGGGFGGTLASSSNERQYPKSTFIGDADFSVAPQTRRQVNIADEATARAIGQMLTNTSGGANANADWLYQSSGSRSLADGQKAPVLGDLPALGQFFRNESSTAGKDTKALGFDGYLGNVLVRNRQPADGRDKDAAKFELAAELPPITTTDYDYDRGDFGAIVSTPVAVPGQPASGAVAVDNWADGSGNANTPPGLAKDKPLSTELAYKLDSVALGVQDLHRDSRLASGALKAKVQEKVKSVDLNDNEAIALTGKSRPKGESDGYQKDGQTLPSYFPVNVVGFVPTSATVPASAESKKSITVGATEAARPMTSPIVLPPAQGETSLALKSSAVTDQKPQLLAEAKRGLEELQRSRQILDTKIASEKIDAELPKTTMVEIADKAVPAAAPSSTLWEKLSGKAGEYKSTARIKVESDQSDNARPIVWADYDHDGYQDLMVNHNAPNLIQIESEAIQSEAVLGKVIKDLNLNAEWGKKQGGGTLTTAETMAQLKKKLDLRPVQNTSLLEIGVKSDKPEEAANIANAIAGAYKAHRSEQRAQLTKGGIAALEERYVEQNKKVREAQKKVDDLGAKLQVPDGATQAPKTDATPSKPATPAAIPQPEVQTTESVFSTFSLNVSDVSFKLAAASLEKGVMPELATVRSEEFINAFDYRDPEPPSGVPVAFAWERAQYPFAQNRDLLRFSIKTAALGRQPGRPLNLVLLLDNSGSMERADRVRIIQKALRVLAGELQPQDKFSVVTFARTAHLWVDGVPGNQAAQVADQVSGLTPKGGTNLEDAMNLAYQTALRHYLPTGVNRVVLLTDGAANLGNVAPEALKQQVEANRKQGIALDCFGIGWEGYNDDLLEILSRNGDGRYGFVNTPEEAATEFAGQLAGALHVAASDVKVQVEFNPGRVTAYRQIGYARHQLTKEQFRDNTVDAAEIAAQEAGNALYVVEVNAHGNGPLATVRVRYKVPGTADYHEHEWPVPYTGNALPLEQASPAMRLTATASAFSEWLVSSPYAGEVTPDRLLGCLSSVPEVYGADARPKKLEWMIRQAKSIAGQ